MPRKTGLYNARIHFLAGRIFARKLKQRGVTGLNPGQGRILFSLWDRPRQTVGELAEATSLNPSTLTLMLDRLEKAGVVKRQASPTDRRSVIVTLTEKNPQLQRRYRAVLREMENVFYQGFSRGEIEACEGFLERILANLSAFESQSGKG